MISRKPPSHLTAEGREIWKTINSVYNLDDQQKLLLKVAMEDYDRFNEARKHINKMGLIYKTSSGYLRPNPSLQIEKEAHSRFLHAWKMLGLNVEAPVGRPTDARELKWDKILTKTKQKQLK